METGARTVAPAVIVPVSVAVVGTVSVPVTASEVSEMSPAMFASPPAVIATFMPSGPATSRSRAIVASTSMLAPAVPATTSEPPIARRADAESAPSMPTPPAVPAEAGE